MYFALSTSVSLGSGNLSWWHHSPFRRIALLLYLGEDAFGFIVYAMATLGHLSVTFDFLFSAHVAGLLQCQDTTTLFQQVV